MTAARLFQPWHAVPLLDVLRDDRPPEALDE